MKNIYTFGHQPAQRNWTVADMRASKGKMQLTEVTAMNGEQAANAAAAGIDTLITRSQILAEVRAAAPNTFITAALMLVDHPTETDVLNAAMRAMDEGADALYTTRSLRTISVLAELDFPVMGHVGLVPPYSTWTGGPACLWDNGARGHVALDAFPGYGRGWRLCCGGRTGSPAGA